MVLDELKNIAGEETVGAINKLVDATALAAVKESGISPAAMIYAIYILQYNLLAKAASEGDEAYDMVSTMLLAANMESSMLAITQGADEYDAINRIGELLKDSGIDWSK